MIYYTTKNALPVKQKMKNAFCENHIFTRFNLTIGHLVLSIGVGEDIENLLLDGEGPDEGR